MNILNALQGVFQSPAITAAAWGFAVGSVGTPLAGVVAGITAGF